jgi:hypothetical protein
MDSKNDKTKRFIQIIKEIEVRSNIESINSKIEENDVNSYADAFKTLELQRHDFVVNLISRSLGYDNTSNKKIYEYLNLDKHPLLNFSPDLIKIESENSINIVEVGVSNNVHAYRITKSEKYLPLTEELMSRKYKVIYSVCVLSSDGSDNSDLVSLDPDMSIFQKFVSESIKDYTKNMKRILDIVTKKGMMSEFNVLCKTHISKNTNWSDDSYNTNWLSFLDDRLKIYETLCPCKPIETDMKHLSKILDKLTVNDFKYDDFENRMSESVIKHSIKSVRELLISDYKDAPIITKDKTFSLPELSGLGTNIEYTEIEGVDKETCQAISFYQNWKDMCDRSSNIIDEIRVLSEIDQNKDLLSNESFKSYKLEKFPVEMKFLQDFSYNMYILKGEERKSYKANNLEEWRFCIKKIKDGLKSHFGEKSFYRVQGHQFKIKGFTDEEKRSMGFRAKKTKEHEAKCKPFENIPVYSPEDNCQDIMQILEVWGEYTNEPLWDFNYDEMPRNIRSTYNAYINLQGRDDMKKTKCLKHIEIMTKLYESIKYTMTYSQSSNKITIGTAGNKDMLYIVGPGKSGNSSTLSKPYKIYFRFRKMPSSIKKSNFNIIEYNNTYYVSTKWLRHPLTVIDSWSTMYYTLRPIILSVMFDSVPGHVNKELASLICAINTSNKKATSVLLADFRYIFMAATSQSCDFNKLLSDKLRIKIKTKLDLYLWNCIIDKIEEVFMSSRKNLVVEKGKLSESNEQMKYNMPSVFSPYYYDNFNASLNEMYLSHMIEKDNRNPMHDQIKGCENALTYLAKYKDIKKNMPALLDWEGVCMTDSELYEKSKACLHNEFGFVNEFVRASADAMMVEIGMNDGVSKELLGSSTMRRNISVLSNMNNSIDVDGGRIKSIESVIKYSDNEEDQLFKLTENIRMYLRKEIDEKEYAVLVLKNDLSILKEATSLLIKDGFKCVFGISRKVQVGDFREIYVMDFKTRICQKLIENYMECLSKIVPEEYISVNSDKRAINLEKDMTTFYSEMFEKGKMVINENADCTKWAPSSTCEEFIAWIDQASKHLHYGMCCYIKYFFLKMLDKILIFPANYIKSAKNNLHSKFKELLELEEKENKLLYPVSFMMGIFNYFSSIKHCAKSSLIRMLSNEVIEGKIVYKSYQHSDDSFKMIGFNNLSDVRSFIHKERITAKLCNIKYSIKKTVFSFYFAEFLSTFYYNTCLFNPYIKFVKSIKDNMEHSSYHGDYFYVLSKATEAFKKGASISTATEILRSGCDMIDAQYGLDKDDRSRDYIPPEMLGRPLPSVVMVAMFGNIYVYDVCNQSYIDLLCKWYKPEVEDELEDPSKMTKTIIGAPHYRYVKRTKISAIAVKAMKILEKNIFKIEDLTIPDLLTKSNMYFDLKYLVKKCFDARVTQSMASTSYHNSFLNVSYYRSNKCVTDPRDDKNLLTIKEFIDLIKSCNAPATVPTNDNYINKIIKLLGNNISAAKVFMKNLSISSIASLSKKKFKISLLNMSSHLCLNLQVCIKALVYNKNPLAINLMYPGLKTDKLVSFYNLMVSECKKHDLGLPTDKFISIVYVRKPVYIMVPKISDSRCVPILNSIIKYSMLSNSIVKCNSNQINLGDEIKKGGEFDNTANILYGSMVNHIKLMCFLEKSNIESVVDRTTQSDVPVIHLANAAITENTELNPTIRADCAIISYLKTGIIRSDVIFKACSFYIYVVIAQVKSSLGWSGDGVYLLCYKDRIYGVIKAKDMRIRVYLSEMPTANLFKEMVNSCGRYFKNTMIYREKLLEESNNPKMEIEEFVLNQYKVMYKANYRYLSKNATSFHINYNMVMDFRRTFDKKTDTTKTIIKDIDEYGNIYDKLDNIIYRFGKYSEEKFVGYNYNTVTQDIDDFDFIDTVMLHRYMSEEPMDYYETVYLDKSESDFKEMYNYVSDKTGLKIKDCLRLLSNNEPIEIKNDMNTILIRKDKAVKTIEEFKDDTKYFQDAEGYESEEELDLDSTDFIHEVADLTGYSVGTSDDLDEKDELDIDSMDFMSKELGLKYQLVTKSKETKSGIDSLVSRFRDKKLDLLLGAYKGTSRKVSIKYTNNIKQVVEETLLNIINDETEKKIINRNEVLYMLYMLLLNSSNSSSIYYSGSVDSNLAVSRIRLKYLDLESEKSKVSKFDIDKLFN